MVTVRVTERQSLRRPSELAREGEPRSRQGRPAREGL